MLLLWYVTAKGKWYGFVVSTKMLNFCNRQDIITNLCVMVETNNILAILDNYLHDNPDEIAKEIAADFRRRRIEKNLTREQVAEKSGVAVSNIVRFEQKGLISLKNLISIAMALEYTSEIRHIFSQQKYSTMEELQEIKRNMNKKKAYRR